MSTLGRRLDRLEGARSRSSPFDVMDPIIAEMSTPELVALLNHDRAVREGRRPTSEEMAVFIAFRDRLALVGIALP